MDFAKLRVEEDGKALVHPNGRGCIVRNPH